MKSSNSDTAELSPLRLFMHSVFIFFILCIHFYCLLQIAFWIGNIFPTLSTFSDSDSVGGDLKGLIFLYFILVWLAIIGISFAIIYFSFRYFFSLLFRAEKKDVFIKNFSTATTANLPFILTFVLTLSFLLVSGKGNATLAGDTGLANELFVTEVSSDFIVVFIVVMVLYTIVSYTIMSGRGKAVYLISSLLILITVLLLAFQNYYRDILLYYLDGVLFLLTLFASYFIINFLVFLTVNYLEKFLDPLLPKKEKAIRKRAKRKSIKK